MQQLAERGLIGKDDMQLIRLCDSEDEVIDAVFRYYSESK